MITNNSVIQEDTLIIIRDDDDKHFSQILKSVFLIMQYNV